MLLLALLAGCGGDGDDTAAPTCEAGGRTEVGVVSSLVFAHADGDVSNGFDLDRAVSEEGGATGCGIGDYTSPDGVPGVDNAFARILPALELTEASAVEGLIQDAINSGALLILYQLDGVDSFEQDDCVDVTMLRGMGTPSMGTDGTLEWSQTFDVDPSTPSDTVYGASITGSRLVAGPVELTLPVQILNADLNFPIKNGYVQLDFLPDGSTRGVLGGEVDSDYIREVASTENIDSSVTELVDTMLTNTSDLVPDEAGTCTAISVTLEFSAVPAYLFEDSP